MKTYMHRNERLRHHRIQRNWRQSDVADQLGVSPITIQRWERGSQQPSIYYRAKLCELFALTTQELGLEEDMDTPPLPEDMNTPPLPEDNGNASQALVASVEGSSLWTVPYARNPHFTGRTNLLTRLKQHFTSSETKNIRPIALTSPLILTGLGGIGKTQIAIEFAYCFREQQPSSHIFWINAANEESILTSFVTMMNLLPNVSLHHSGDQHQLVAAVLRWLEQSSLSWLLIVDNADDLVLVQPYLPQHGNGNILLTTRARAVALLGLPLEVDNMLLEDGIRFLLYRTQRLNEATDDEIMKARQVVEALAMFPLALDQAGAYIEETGCRFSTYLDLYQEHRQMLLARRGTLSTYYPKPVAMTWALSFQHIEQRNPAAAHLLRLCAFLAPDHIPEELLTQGARHWPPLLQQAVADPFTFNQMIQELLAFSLVKRLSSAGMLSLHRLVQVVQQEQLNLQEQCAWAECVVHAIHALFPNAPKDVSTWPQCQRYLEQVQACEMLIQQYQIQLPEAAEILDRAGNYCREMGVYTIAEPLLQRALHMRKQQMGAHHLATTESLNNLALLYSRQGKYYLAEPLLQQALHIREQQVGAEHLATAQSLHNLALLYFLQGKYFQAQPLFQKAFTLAEQQLGPDHEKTANCLENLAELYTEQGKHEQAELYYRRALMIAEDQLVPEHSLVVYSLTGLAKLYLVQGKDKEAEPLFQRALAINERQWGAEHPQIAYPLLGLGTLYSRQGKYTQAESLFRRALTIWEQQGHPHMTRALNGLGTLYSRQGKYAQAEPLFQQALAIDVQQLGAEHPETAQVLSDLATFQELQGHSLEALSLYQQVYAIYKRVFGPDHSKTRDTQQQIAALGKHRLERI